MEAPCIERPSKHNRKHHPERHAHPQQRYKNAPHTRSKNSASSSWHIWASAIPPSTSSVPCSVPCAAAAACARGAFPTYQ